MIDVSGNIVYRVVYIQNVVNLNILANLELKSAESSPNLYRVLGSFAATKPSFG